MQKLDMKTYQDAVVKGVRDQYAKAIKPPPAKGKVTPKPEPMSPEKLAQIVLAELTLAAEKCGKPYQPDKDGLAGSFGDMKLKNGAFVAEIVFSGSANDYMRLAEISKDKFVLLRAAQGTLFDAVETGTAPKGEPAKTG